MQGIPRKWLIIGAIVLAVVGCIAIFSGIGRLFGGGNQAGTGENGVVGELGQVYVASQVDSAGCPVQVTNTFGPTDIIYAGLTESVIPAGTDMFMRLSYEGQPVEDTDAITADQDIRGCAWFQFSPTGSFDPGTYEVELIINGNIYDQASFTVSGTGASSGAVAGDVQLGRLYASSEIDNAGCPVDDVSEFRPEETIYAALTDSFIPNGTAMFARLLYEGDPVEDTDEIVADRDLQSCVWFSFEPTGAAGFDAGSYTAEIYVDGTLADSVQFDVR